MDYIGNYKDWIKSEWIDYLLNNKGHRHIRSDPSEYGKNNSATKLIESGWDLSRELFSGYENDNFPFEIEMPFDLGDKFDWWFIKLLPGQLIPVHQDHNVSKYENLNCRRYWMPLQDYQTGHFFMFEGNMIKNYKAGDIFAYGNQNGIHGAANLAWGVTRLTFNFTSYGDYDD